MTGNRGCRRSSEMEDRAEGREVVDDKEVVTGEKDSGSRSTLAATASLADIIFGPRLSAFWLPRQIFPLFSVAGHFLRGCFSTSLCYSISGERKTGPRGKIEQPI